MRRRSICTRMFIAFLVTMTFNTFFLIVLAWFIGPSFLYTMRDINVRNIVDILEKELSGSLSENNHHAIQDSLDEILLMDTGIEACRVYDNTGRSVVFALNGWR